MRKNCARKWLHLVIDLLPVLILPIFAIWEINHKENESISVEVENHEIVDLNQKIKMSRTWSSAVPIENDYTLSLNGSYSFIRCNDDTGLNMNHIYYIRTQKSSVVSSSNALIYLRAWSSGGNLNLSGVEQNIFRNKPYTTSLQFVVTTYNNYQFTDYQFSINIFDLTQMYGEGNEPSSADFTTWLDETWYPYISSKKSLITNGTIVYDNTDIGSQMLYAIYKPVQQYFNFDNIFNFGALRNWFELNFFNGNMGIPMTIIWNIIIYEFLSDVIMLIYAFFMFIIDFANDLLEKPFSDIKRG